MDRTRPRRRPPRFDALTGEATRAIDRAASALHRVRDRFQTDYHREFLRWQELQERVDTVERELREESQTVDRSALRSLVAEHEELTAQLGRRRAELARLELLIRSVEGSGGLLRTAGDGAPTVHDALPTDVVIRVVEARESERARLAQEIHDGPAQALSNSIFQVEFAERVLKKDPRLAEAELRLLRDLLRRGLADVRSYITQLRPTRLLQLGLYGAIGETAEDLHALSGVIVETALDAPPDEIDEAAQTVVLRIVQEALQNVRKHAEATRVAIVSSSDGVTWRIEVRDDGRGFDPADVAARQRRSFGLEFMRERATLINAGFDVRSRPDGGTVVALSIPVRKE